jgi:hypothetical protein
MSTDGVDTAYHSDGLRDGGRRSADAAALADETVGILIAAVPPAATDFGDVLGAGALAASISRARQVHTSTAQAAHQRHVDLQRNAERTAAAGDRLTGTTTDIAGSAGSAGSAL